MYLLTTLIYGGAFLHSFFFNFTLDITYVFSLHWGTQTSKTEIQTGNPKLQTDIFQSLQTDESYTDVLVNDELA